jgi:hypothetical protein
VVAAELPPAHVVYEDCNAICCVTIASSEGHALTIACPLLGRAATVLAVIALVPIASSCGGKLASVPSDASAAEPIGAAGGTIASPDGRATLNVPAGALTHEVSFSIVALANPPAGALGTVYDIEPTGTTFSVPVLLELAYDPTSLAGANPSELTLGAYSNGAWNPAAIAGQDTTRRVISAQIGHLSAYGIVRPAHPSCTTDSDCDPDFPSFSCKNGVGCVLPCTSTADCPSPYICDSGSGTCRDWLCNSDSDCPRSGDICALACAQACPRQACPGGQICLYNSCRFTFCALGLAPCPSGYACNDPNIGGICLPNRRSSSNGDGGGAPASDAGLHVTGCIRAPQGLVSWWTGDGTTADHVGPNPGTLRGTATYNAGFVGQAFSFDGNGDMVAPTVGLPTGSSARTIELWGKVTSTGTNNQQHVFAEYGTLGTFGATYVVLALPTTLAFTFSQWGDALQGTSVGTGAWHHLAATSVGTTVTLYFDGQVVGQKTFTILNTAAGTRFDIGGQGVAPDGQLDRLVGLADEVSVYNRALSAAEIQSIVAAGAAGKCK